MTVQRIEEFLIGHPQREAIRQLLGACFAGYPADRTYYKQPPTFRYLVSDGEQLAAHMAVEHRLINNDGQVLYIFGIVDLCVAPAYQNRKLASHLLQLLEVLGKENAVDFLVLLTGNHAFYRNSGFELKDNLCQWVMFHDHQTIGVRARRMKDMLMVKALNDKEWRAGVVDFQGPLF